VSAWTFCHAIYVLSCFHHYTFHLLPVIIYTQAFPFCFLYLVSNYASVQPIAVASSDAVGV